MTIFILGVILAALVATTYLSLGARDFRRIRREINAAAQLDSAGGAELASANLNDGTVVDPAKETVGFAWRALAGVITSIALLFTISHFWWAWYAFPTLALGTGVAVSVAFVIDPTRTSS